MIKFLKCASLCEEENSDLRLSNFINDLNNEFGNLNCSCHPFATWNIAVDLLKNCKYDFHTVGKGVPKNPKCNFWNRLYENHIEPKMINK